MTSSAIFDRLETGLDVIIENQINNEKKTEKSTSTAIQEENQTEGKSKEKQKQKNTFFCKLWLIFIDMKIKQINFFFHYFCITSCHVISS